MDSIGRNESGRLWMKKHLILHPDAISFILFNCDESFIDRLLPNWIKTRFLGAAGQFGQLLAVLKSGYASFSLNLDLFFDYGLLIVLHKFLTEQENMSGLILVVLCAMAIVIFLPMFYDYCGLFKNRTSKEKFLLFCCFPIFPLVTHRSTLELMCTQATIQLEIDNMTMSSTILDRTILAKKICDTADDLWKKVEELEQIKSVIDKRRLLETSAEGQPQSYIKGILLLLTLSLTQIEYIPATIFGKDIEFFGIPIPSKLILMVLTLNPILMNGIYYLGAICKKRSIVGSILLVLFIFACILGKFVSIVAVFSPPLGLFSILGHWKEQQTPFSCNVMIPPNGDGFFYGVVQGAVTRKNWTDIGGPLCKNGTDYVNIQSRNITNNLVPEDASTYFLFDLKATCVFVALVTFARLIAIYKVKMWFTSDFSRKTPFVRINHILYSGLGAVPLTWSNWEVEEDLPGISLVFHKERMERMLLLTIHLFENILLLLPMVFTWFKIQARHTILENSIGTTELEKMSCRNALRLLVGSLFLVLLCFLIEIILFPIYYRFAHIWKELLNQARLPEQEKKNNNLSLKEIEMEGGKQFFCSEPAKKTTGDVEPLKNIA